MLTARTRCFVVALTMLAGPLGAATPSGPSSAASLGGEAVWGPTATLSAPGRVDPASLALAVGADGTAASTWCRHGRVATAVHPPHGRWGTPVVLGRAVTAWGCDPQVAVDGQGTVTVAWTALHDRLLVRSRPHGGPWGAPVRLNRPPALADIGVWGPSLAVNRVGVGVVAWSWTRDDFSDVSHIASAYRPAGGRWGRQVVVRKSAGEVEVTLDRRGNAALYFDDELGSRIGVVRRVVGRGWLEPHYLDKGEPGFEAAGNADGDQVVVFSRRRGLWASTRSAGGRWSTSTWIGDGADPAVAIDGRGRATAAFADRGAAGGATIVEHSPRGVWSLPRMLSGATGPAARLRIAANPNGDRVVTWLTEPSDSKQRDLWSAYRSHGGSWTAPVRLSGSGTKELGGPVVAIHSSGRAVSAWTSSRGDEPSSWRRVRVRQTTRP